MVWTVILRFLKGPWTKVFVTAGIAVALWYVANYTLTWYDNQLKNAFKQGQSEIIYDQNEETIQDYELQLDIQEMEKAELQERLVDSYKEVEVLKKQLLVDHDLDKLLQAKPGLTLKSVNEGTNEVFAELEAISND